MKTCIDPESRLIIEAILHDDAKKSFRICFSGNKFKYKLNFVTSVSIMKTSSGSTDVYQFCIRYWFRQIVSYQLKAFVDSREDVRLMNALYEKASRHIETSILRTIIKKLILKS